jgi:hypothetical protein
VRKIERAATSRETEEKLTQNQMHELLESEHARTFVEGAEERGFVEPAEIEAFALEHDLGEEDAEQFQPRPRRRPPSLRLRFSSGRPTACSSSSRTSGATSS